MSDNKFEYIVKEKDQELPIKELLKRNFKFSSRLMRKLKTNNCVELNGSPVKMYMQAKEGDRITVKLPPEKSEFEPQEIPIDVVFEDEDLLIINKQPGVVVHPTKGHPSYTMANGIMNYMLKEGKSFKIRFINRLDMNTSGLLIVAKNSHCQDNMSKQMDQKSVQKKYLAVVKGIMKEDSGTIDKPIARLQEDHIIRGVVQGGFPSVTHYKVLERFPKGYTLVELLLETGRTHQIRVHLSDIGHPVVGDELYGEYSVWLIERQALHASYLSFKHPITGEDVEVSAPFPQDMQKLIERIR
ncbi:MAG: RluA family pseudouridine synthase [Anaerovoracaceae bacterium]|jgi:23S rRNA pseudouridine1911/1915/1917 synthase